MQQRPPLGTWLEHLAYTEAAGKASPNTKYRSCSALFQKRAGKLVSGGGELTTRVEPATISCET